MNSSNLTQKLLKDIGFTLLSEGKTIKIRAEGYSMFPSVKPGSIIYIEPLEKDENPRPGDIIAWKRGSGLVVHRLTTIIKCNEGLLFVTRGDSSLVDDLPILPGDIAGRVLKIEDANGEEVPPALYSVRRRSHLLNRLQLKISLYLDKSRKIIRSLLSGR
jgi:signal peptidase I